MTSMYVQPLTETATIPTKGTPHSAGFDLSADHDITIAPGERVVIKTGLAIRVPDGCYGRIAPRSGLAVKNGINVLAGVIDQDYTQEVGVVLINHSKEPFEIKAGNRVAQLILEKYESNVTVEKVEQLPTTSRTGGFGSTGV